MPHITYVKKILADGSPCKKCAEVSERLEEDGVIDLINQIAIADESDADSTGMQLAKKHNVTRAPFFVLEQDNGEVEVFDVYFKFRKYAYQHLGAKQPAASL